MVTDTLTIAMNGILVGYLKRQSNGAMSFQYDTNWLNRPSSRPVSLSLRLREQPYTGSIVYNFFENLLPDSRTIIEKIQTRFKVTSSHPFDLLATIGRDCIGAIQIYTKGESLSPVSSVTATPLSNTQIGTLLREYYSSPLGMNDQSDFRISLAGAQEKTALLWHNGQWNRPIGSTPTSHIIKLPIGKIAYSNIDLSESCENEWLCLQLANAFGLPATHAELKLFDEQMTLVVERFDRQWSSDGSWLMRLPQEDFCQALGISPANKYESMGGPSIKDGMALLMGAENPLHDREIFFKAQIFYWMLAAIDGHGKNFSIAIKAGGSYSLTPLYDIISAYPLFRNKSLQSNKVKMAMAMTGKNRHYEWQQILPRHLVSTANTCGLTKKQAYLYLEELAQLAKPAIDNISSNLPKTFPTYIAEAIFGGIYRQVDLLKRALPSLKN